MTIMPTLARPALLACAFVVAATFATPAAAQWMWKDDAGHVVASDQPPPAGTPPSRILRSPRARPNGSPAPAPAPEAQKSEAKSLADRELESKQHAKEAADAQKKADDDAARAKAMAENCRQVRSNVAALQAGGRASRFNEKGEKVYIDDAQRADEINRQQAQIAQYCR